MRPVFFVPMKLESTNAIYAGQRWGKRHKSASAAHLEVKIAIMQSDLRKVRFTEQVDLTFVPQVGHGQQRLDCSNYSYVAKMVEDGLVRAKVLPGDGPEHVSGFEIVAPIRVWDEPPGMWVIIEPSTRAQAAHAKLPVQERKG